MNFETGKSILTQDSYGVLDKIAELLIKYPEYRLTIGGYTDNVGKESTNQKISEDRARACMTYLITKGCNPASIVIIGYGESNPIATNDTAEGRALNRRVEFNLALK